MSYGAHFLVKKAQGEAPKVMPLEAQWWVDDPAQQNIVAAVALGQATMADSDRERWQWKAMIVQPEPIDAKVVARAVEQARAKKDLPGLAKLRYQRWEEGRSAQVMHVGPYAEENPSIVRLHEGIAAAGFRPRGRHHEIYLGDPRRSAPEKLRTILRHPVEPPPAASWPTRVAIGALTVKRIEARFAGNRTVVTSKVAVRPLESGAAWEDAGNGRG